MTCPNDSFGLLSLPDESLLNIFQYLNYEDLTSLCKTCQKLRKLCTDDILWRWQCKYYFLSHTIEEGMGWHHHFVQLYHDYGRYISLYRQIRRAWTKIEHYLSKHCPNILASLTDGVSESDLDDVERHLGVPLPDDVRLSYRIHNGQELHARSNVAGMFGGGMVSTHIRTDALVPVDTFKTTYKSEGDLAGCVILTQDRVNHSLQILALSNHGGYTPGTIYNRCPEEHPGHQVDCFVAGDTMKDFLCSYADMLEREAYYTIHEHIFKFYHEPSCVAETAGVKVMPTTCFMPELSRISESIYFFAYRIILEMSSETPVDLSCRLETRHWLIISGDGEEEQVNGPGVVGEYPVMKPGTKFDWISCCTFHTPTGSMGGHFKFRNLHTGLITEVECPRFHMKAPPILTGAQRKQVRDQLGLAGPDLENSNT